MPENRLTSKWGLTYDGCKTKYDKNSKCTEFFENKLKKKKKKSRAVCQNSN